MKLDTVYAPPNGAVAVQWRTGLYGCPPHVTRTTQAPAVDAVYWTAFRVTRPVSIVSLGVESQAGAATSTVRIAIYADATTHDTPGAVLVQTSDLVTTGTGMIEEAVSITLAPGTYWTGVLAHTAAATLRASTTFLENIAQTSANSLGANPRPALSQTGVTTTFSDPAVPNGVQTTAPIVFMKVA